MKSNSSQSFSLIDLKYKSCPPHALFFLSRRMRAYAYMFVCGYICTLNQLPHSKFLRVVCNTVSYLKELLSLNWKESVNKRFNISIIIVFAPTAQSTEEEIVSFYAMLDNAKAQYKSQETWIPKIGNKRDGEIVSTFGLGIGNEQEEKWVQWCAANDHVIASTWFQEHSRRLWTWRSTGETKQIDYITINVRFRNKVVHCKTYPSADFGNDHLPVICKLRTKLRKLKKFNAAPKFQYKRLLNDPNPEGKYMNSVKIYKGQDQL